MEVSNYLVSWFTAYLGDIGDLQPTYRGVMIQLLSTMDVPAVKQPLPFAPLFFGLSRFGYPPGLSNESFTAPRQGEFSETSLYG